MTDEKKVTDELKLLDQLEEDIEKVIRDALAKSSSATHLTVHHPRHHHVDRRQRVRNTR